MTPLMRGWFGRNRAQLRLGVRITVACLAAFGLAHLLGLAQGYWAVLTSVIVMQASVGGSLKATLDRFVGSLGGAVWGVSVSLVITRGDTLMIAVALAVAVAPLAVLAALKPAYRVAPVTAIILLLTPSGQFTSPLASALSRMLEIGLGSVVALLVALLVLPARAHQVLADAAGRALQLMGELPPLLTRGLEGRGEAGPIRDLHDGVRQALGRVEAAADEAARERANFLTAAPDPDPLVRTLRRLRGDLVMIARAAAVPFPPEIWAVSQTSILGATETIGDYLRASGRAVLAGQPALPLDAVDAAFAAHIASMAALRQAGLTRDLPEEIVGRLFGLAFGLEQFGQNLHDLADRINELARPSTGGGAIECPP